MPKHWVVSAGDDGRDYSNFFLRYGMAFFDPEKAVRCKQELQKDDLVVLKSGKSEIIAAGKVVERNGQIQGEGDKKWLEDVEGWPLTYYINVDWKKPSNPIPTRGLRQGTFYQLYSTSPIQVAQQIIQNDPLLLIEPEPELPERIEDIEILNHLMKQGKGTRDVYDVMAAINKVRMLAGFYYENYKWKNLTEHDIRTFLVVPLLLALGWSEQMIRLEYIIRDPKNSKRLWKVDVACFDTIEADGEAKPENCKMIIETKQFFMGLEAPMGQICQYSSLLCNCQKAVATNGYCYKIFKEDNTGKINTVTPDSYLNLRAPTRKFPLDNQVDGALQALVELLP